MDVHCRQESIYLPFSVDLKAEPAKAIPLPLNAPFVE